MANATHGRAGRVGSVFLVAAALWSCVSAAAAQAPLETGLGGPAGFGSGVLHPNDDGSSAAIDLTPAFPQGLEYFGQRFTSVYVNNNGNITFGGATGTFTPQAFPLVGNRMIAPFWADVDTSSDGRPGRNGVYWDLRPGRMVITWFNVGYFAQHDELQNTFQLIIESNAAFDEDHMWRVELRYVRCEWTTGDASGGRGGFGGTPAQAGFDAGDGHTGRVLPGSGTRQVLNLCRGSNVGVAGVWLFNISNGVPQAMPDPGTQTYDFSRPPPHSRRPRGR